MAFFLRIPAGEFWMGSERGFDDERPLHPVRLDAFELAAFQVTNAEYAEFLKENDVPSPVCWEEPLFDDPRQPVCGVSWFEAVAYCDWLSEKLKCRIHLPTEAQREYAARGGVEGEEYPWGDGPLPLEGPYALGLEGPEVGRPRPVGLGRPNRFGLYNIADNVHEWCADWYDPSYYAISPTRNPPGPPKGERRVARGGSWRHEVKFCRNAARAKLGPEKRFTDFGFRVARSPEFSYPF